MKKAKRLTMEITELIASGYVSVQGAIDRDCPPRIWASAMDAMVGNQTIKRPLNGHNYLRKVAHDLAVEASRHHEAGIRNAEQHHQRPTTRSLSGAEGPGPARINSINPLAHLMED